MISQRDRQKYWPSLNFSRAPAAISAPQKQTRTSLFLRDRQFGEYVA